MEAVYINKFSEYFNQEDLKYIVAVLHLEEREFDSFGERIRGNIARALNCDPSEPDDFSLLPDAVTNINLGFSMKGEKYAYRCPGFGTELYIDRKSETFGNTVAHRLNIDPSFLYIDEDEGWKISKFIHFTRKLDYHNINDVEKALEILRTLHNSGEKAPRDFMVWDETVKIYEDIREFGMQRYSDFESLYEKMSNLVDLTKKDGAPLILCHVDCWKPNFLVTETEDGNSRMDLIDWEFSGNCDAGMDIGTFICCSDYTYDEGIDVIKRYYHGNPSKTELRHMLAYTAIASYYWYILTVFYLARRGVKDEENEKLWYDNSILYSDGALIYYQD